MALQKEIWLSSIIAQLFALNTFAVRSIDHSAFVNNKTVHVPAAGSLTASTTKPTAAQTRTDTDLSYDLQNYYVPWIVVERLEQVELSYNMRESISAQIVAAIQDLMYRNLITGWLPSGFTKLATTGGAAGKTVAATAPSATGTRYAMSKADVLAVRKQFDKWDIPLEGRCLLLSADMYNQLLQDLTEAEGNAFLSTANAGSGIVGKIYGFEVYMRSTVLTMTGAGAIKTGAAAGTDGEGGLAWHAGSVSRAIGKVNVYGNNGDPTLYGDAISCDCRAGGRNIRSGGIGVLAIYQGTPAA
jgi:hypothetical protein